MEVVYVFRVLLHLAPLDFNHFFFKLSQLKMERAKWNFDENAEGENNQ